MWSQVSPFNDSLYLNYIKALNILTLCRCFVLFVLKLVKSVKGCMLYVFYLSAIDLLIHHYQLSNRNRPLFERSTWLGTAKDHLEAGWRGGKCIYLCGKQSPVLPNYENYFVNASTYFLQIARRCYKYIFSSNGSQQSEWNKNCWHQSNQSLQKISSSYFSDNRWISSKDCTTLLTKKEWVRYGKTDKSRKKP